MRIDYQIVTFRGERCAALPDRIVTQDELWDLMEEKLDDPQEYVALAQVYAALTYPPPHNCYTKTPRRVHSAN